MQIAIDEMRTGANRSYSAAWLAMEGADQLSRTSVAPGIFGSFAAADTFAAAVDTAHSNHCKQLRTHESRLGVLGDKAHTAASEFVDMEQRNTEALRLAL